MFSDSIFRFFVFSNPYIPSRKQNHIVNFRLLLYQNSLKEDAVKKIVEWIPAIHIIAVEKGWNVEGAHQCLLFAVKIFNHLRGLATV